MEERNTAELSGDELIHAIVAEVEQLQSEQFDHSTAATLDSLLPNYGRCNIVYVDEMLAESGPEIATFHLGTGLDDKSPSDCDIRLQQTKLKPLDSFRSNFVGRNCDEINPNRNDGFGVQEKSTEPSAELVATQTQFHQQQEILSELHQNNTKLELRHQWNTLTESHRPNVKPFLDYGQQLQNPQVERESTAEVSSRTELEICEYDTVMMNERSPLHDFGQVEHVEEECNEGRVVTRSIDDVDLHDESEGRSAQPMSLFQNDNINQSDRSLRTKQVSSVDIRKVDRRRITFEMQNTGASSKNPQSSRPGSKLHSCGECKKQFNSKSHLTRHVRIHTGEKPFQCEICNAAFNQRESLKTHRRVHSGEKPYKCQYCNAAFSDLRNLRRHQPIHSDDRPFMCNICKKTFRQKSYMSRHMDIHSGRKAHKCNVCEKELRQKSHLTKHFEIHLKRKPSQL